MLDSEQAKELCHNLLRSLSDWPALNAALQAGGLEQKATGLIGSSLEAIAARHHHLVLREYKHIDFALVDSASVGGPILRVETVVEVKFNYAQQLGEIRARVPEALDQATDYLNAVGAASACVLYLVAGPFGGQRRAHPRDAGWNYCNGDLADAVEAIRTGAHEEDAPWFVDDERGAFYCAVIGCPIRAG